MKITRAHVRRATTLGLSTLLLLVVAPVVSEFFIELAKQQGAYDNPAGRVDSVMGTLSNMTTSWWFLVILGLVAGGTFFMWADYIIRTRRKKDNAFNELTEEESADICADIARTRSMLSLTPDGASHDGVHEAASLSFKLAKKGILSPIFIAPLKERIVNGNFGEDFNNYLAAITPYIRSRDLDAARTFAKHAIWSIYKQDADDKITEEEWFASLRPVKKDEEI